MQSLGTRVGLGRSLVTAGKSVGVHVPVPVPVSGEEEGGGREEEEEEGKEDPGRVLEEHG